MLCPQGLSVSSLTVQRYLLAYSTFPLPKKTVPGSPDIEITKLSKIDMQKLPTYITFVAGCSSESRATATTKTFTGESNLTGAIIQTRAATTEILLREKWKETMNAN